MRALLSRTRPPLTSFAASVRVRTTRACHSHLSMRWRSSPSAPCWPRAVPSGPKLGERRIRVGLFAAPVVVGRPGPRLAGCCRGHDLGHAAAAGPTIAARRTIRTIATRPLESGRSCRSAALRRTRLIAVLTALAVAGRGGDAACRGAWARHRAMAWHRRRLPEFQQARQRLGRRQGRPAAVQRLLGTAAALVRLRGDCACRMGGRCRQTSIISGSAATAGRFRRFNRSGVIPASPASSSALFGAGSASSERSSGASAGANDTSGKIAAVRAGSAGISSLDGRLGDRLRLGRQGWRCFAGRSRRGFRCRLGRRFDVGRLQRCLGLRLSAPAAPAGGSRPPAAWAAAPCDSRASAGSKRSPRPTRR